MLFDWNEEEHLTEGKGMFPMVPADASPLCYGMNVMGGNRVWTIGANTEYPELCMAIINYLTTPEGYMTYWYGPNTTPRAFASHGARMRLLSDAVLRIR